MPIWEYLRQIGQNAAHTWRSLTASARVNIAITSILAIAFIGAVIYMGSRPQYATLFDNLDASDYTAIQQMLSERGEDYRSARNGTAIEVPSNRVSDLRLALQAEGIPRSHGRITGFEAFDSTNMMMTQREQEIRYQRALQGELQRMLNEFDFVNRSFVMIREAEDELLLSEQKPSTAAVTLDLSRSPNKDEVAAIVNIIASFGGARLSSEHITLATTDGKQLHGPSGDGMAFAANSQLDYYREVRNEYVSTAEAALSRMGKRSVVTVRLDVDFSRTREITETPLEGQPVSTYSQSRTLTSRDSLPEGPTGATQNLPVDAPPPGGTETVESTESTLENFETGRSVVERTIEPGQVTPVAATVVVEGEFQDVLGDNGEPTGERTYVAPEADELDTYKMAAANALNLDAEAVEVRDQPLDPAEFQTATATFQEFERAANWDRVIEIGILVGKILLVGVGILLVRRFLLRAVRTEDEMAEENVLIDVPRASPDEVRKMEIASEVERVAKEQPEQVAALLRTWMSEPE